MTVARAVRPDRPSTRQRSSTREPTIRDVRKGTTNTKSTRQASPSARSTRGSTVTAQADIHAPRRKASTRSPSASTSRPSTRTASTRATSTRASSTRTSRSSTRSDSGQSTRNQRQAEIREANKAEKKANQPAPIQVFSEYVIVMFFILVVSVIAYGLLKGDPVAQVEKPDQPSFTQVEVQRDKPGTTSTNTGILRGNHQGAEE